MAKWQALILAGLVLTVTGCSKQSGDPVVFLPKQVGADGTDLEAIRIRNCDGSNVSMDGDLLTTGNFRAVFNCANYDGTLKQLGPLLTNEQFPAFLKNINLILASDSAKSVKETLHDWIEEGPEGSSRADRLLPVIANVIKNQSFQAGLPLISSILSAGEDVWGDLAPGLAAVLYQERYPNNFKEMFNLFSSDSDEAVQKDYAKSLKNLANFLQADSHGETVAMRGLEVAAQIKDLKLADSSAQKFLDQMNENGVFVSLFLENGAVRGEELNPKLNSKPEPGDDEGGVELTPEQRRMRNWKILFARGPKGELPPVMKLIGIADEFQKDHKDFVPALGRWFSTNATRVKLTDALTEYVVRAQVSPGLVDVKVSGYLNDYADDKGIDTDEPMEPAEFVKFLKGAFADAKFGAWLDPLMNDLNQEKLGQKNAKLLAGSSLKATILELYSLQSVADYGAEVYKLAPLPKNLSSAIRKYSNAHRDPPLEVEFHGKKSSVQDHMLDAWWNAANETLGEGVIVDFALPLIQSVVTNVTTDFNKNGKTVAEWYFSSPYTDPSTTETIAAYAFQDLQLLDKYNNNRDYLLNKLPDEIFTGSDAEQNEANKRAFRALVSEIPTIWTYWKAGMARSGNDLTRAMASKDKGSAIKNYVAILTSAYRNGMAEKVVDLMSVYQNYFPSAAAPVSDDIEDKRKVSVGADALKKILRSFFKPDVKGKYETSTLGRLLVPLSNLVSEEKRGVTERFLIASAHEILSTPDEKINNFCRDFSVKAEPKDENIGAEQNTLRAVSDTLKKENLPAALRQANSFFQNDSVKPALDYLATRINDGSFKDVLKFLRRVLGFRGN
ncbi:MAG: hypothetical protein ACXVBE_10340 [Bdellovibrionota bacterium]